MTALAQTAAMICSGRASVLIYMSRGDNKSWRSECWDGGVLCNSTPGVYTTGISTKPGAKADRPTSVRTRVSRQFARLARRQRQLSPEGPRATSLTRPRRTTPKLKPGRLGRVLALEKFLFRHAKVDTEKSVQAHCVRGGVQDDKYQHSYPVCT